MGTANVVYEFKTAPKTSKFRPYLIGGGGVYNFKAKPSDRAITGTTLDHQVRHQRGRRLRLQGGAALACSSRAGSTTCSSTGQISTSSRSPSASGSAAVSRLDLYGPASDAEAARRPRGGLLA